MCIVTKPLHGWLYLVVFALVIGAPAIADAQTKCQRRATKQIAKFDAQVDKLQGRYEEKHERLVTGYLDDISSTDERDRLAATFQAAIDEYDFDAFLANSRQLKDEIREATADGASGPCKVGDSTEDFFKRTVEALETYQDSALEALQDRIDIENVGPGEGLAVIAMYIEGPVMRLTLDKRGSMTGARAFNELPEGQFFRVIKLPAGEYQWTTVRSRRVFTYSYWADSTVYYFDFRDADMAFRVEPGKLNFTGVFMYTGSGQRARADLKDRSSIVMRIIENRYPELLERYPVFNGAVPEDTYLQFFVDERRQEQEAAP
ncbi:MAG: hypothetical protein AAFX44_05995 [Pseudomonadota bacterium]